MTELRYHYMAPSSVLNKVLDRVQAELAKHEMQIASIKPLPTSPTRDTVKLATSPTRDTMLQGSPDLQKQQFNSRRNTVQACLRGNN